jgi:glycosyltransferase involved in cell wall biosynthesis
VADGINKKLKMKILVVSAHYPPYHSGGYELRIKDIMDGLIEKGHDIRILTTISTNRNLKTKNNSRYKILRKLHNRKNAKFFPKEVLFDLLDTKCLDDQINFFTPDVIYLGHIYNLSKALLPFLAEQNIPLILDEGGASLEGAWTEHGRWFRFTGDYGQCNFLIRLVKPIVMKNVQRVSQGRISSTWQWPENMHVIINSKENIEKIRQIGVPLRNTAVLNSGIDLEVFTYHPRKSLEQPVMILSPGRLEQRKGGMDALNLLARLKETGIDARLSLIGAKASEKFHQDIEQRIIALGLLDDVAILDMVSHEELVGLYHAADICFFTSYQKMGFSRTPLEAMACGCVVISYGNEGSNEVIENRLTGLLAEEGNIPQVVEFIQLLLENQELYRNIACNARHLIENRFSIEAYIDQIETALINYVRQ